MKVKISFLILCFAALALAEFRCSDGVPYKENACNTCTCKNNRLSCTDMACNSEKSIRLRQCKVGSEWRIRCNDCWCDEQLKTVCTNSGC
ncbi:hypothetical protein FQR65_LT06799 [Abscondita terminalis]|nr:hypothetical protein FQR65_LT06799 [Abscondita terminalis]